MSTKLQPTLAEIPEIQPEQRTMKMRCTGKGEALWARFELLYPIVITSRKFLGHLANGAAQDCEIIAVSVGGKMLKALPSHVGPGNVDVILQAKGSTGIEVVLSCRIEPQTAGEAASSDAVDDAVAALTEMTTKVEARPEDPAPRPPPVDPRARLVLESSSPDLLSGEGPFGDLPPAVAAQATENLQDLLDAKNLDPETKASIQAFLDADGDPTATLKAAQGKREMEPV